jgi:hypothetical protein
LAERAKKGVVYVDAVTEEDLLAVVSRSLAQGLSHAAVRYRLSCLAVLGIKARVHSFKPLKTLAN